MRNLFFFYIAFLTFPYFGATLTVINTNDAGAGSLRNQILSANNGDSINFDPNLIASGSNTIFLLSEISFSTDLTITGLYNSNDTLYISGGNVNRIFSLDGNSNVVLDSLYLINGFAFAGGGAGVGCNEVGNLLVTNSFFKGNISSYPYRGGAINFRSNSNALSEISSMQIDNCHFYENSAQYGGGVASTSYVKYPNETTISNSHFYSNSALYGGGVYYDNYADSLSPTTPLTISNCVLDTNTADYGPGIYVSTYGFHGCDVIVANCKLRSNASPGGSGVIGHYSYSESDEYFQLIDSEIENNLTTALAVTKSGEFGTFSTQLLRSTISNNTWNSNVALISLSNGPTSQLNAEILQSTISGNSCSDYGPSVGAVNFSSPNPASFLKIKNSTIVKNAFLASSTAAIIDSYNSTGQREITSSIIALNTPQDINDSDTIISGGYSIFSDPFVHGSINSDQLLVDSISLKLSTLAYNGGNTKTCLPLEGSFAINAGNPLDFTNAQNGPITAIRDVGAAETTSTTPSSVGLNSLENEFYVLLPNPTEHYFNITSISEGAIELVIIRNAAGQIVKQWSNYQINSLNDYFIDELSNGFYYVLIQQENKTNAAVIKLLKK